MTDKYYAADFARTLGCASVEAFENARRGGLIPAPDGVFDKRPYWRRETIQKTVETHANGIRAAWGQPPVESEGGEHD